MGAWSWAFWIGGALLALLGLGLLYRSLLHDRSRGRRRCPKCWYDMTGVPGLRCPECGREIRAEKQLYKTRRHKRWSAAALLAVAIGTALTGAPRVVQKGWLGATPTWALILAHAYDNTPGSALEVELGTRRADRQDARAVLNRQTWRWYARRLSGTPQNVVSSFGTLSLRPFTRERSLDIYAALGPHAAPDLDVFLPATAPDAPDGELHPQVEWIIQGLVKESPVDHEVASRLVNHENRLVRACVARGFAQSADHACRDLWAKLLSDTDHDVRDAALSAIVHSARPTSFMIPDVVAQIVRNPRDAMWTSVCTNMLINRGAEAVPYFTAMLGNADPDLRAIAARAHYLVGTGARSAYPTLAARARTDPSPEVRGWCVLAIGTWARPDDKPEMPLRECLATDPNAGVRARAIDAMFIDVPRGKYAETVALALADDDAEVRRNAAKYLLHAGTTARSSRAAIARAATDPDGEVSRNAKAALDVLDATPPTND